MTSRRVVVLIPCHNEATTIAQVVRDYSAALPEAVIYVYDNNSTDGTAEAAQEAGATVRFERRQGKGNVMRQMFRDIDADCYVLVDGDDTYPADQVPQMVSDVLDHGADMVIGDRLSSTYFTENTRRFHNTGNVVVRRLVNWFFRGDVRDIMTGLRAFSYEFVKSFPVLSRGFEIETEMTIHALEKNFRVTSVLVAYRDRPAGSTSKLNTVSDGMKVLATIIRLLKDIKPFFFFSVIALALSAVSIGLTVPIAVTYVQTHLVPRFPTLIVAGFILLCAALAFVCGLILDTEARGRRQSFELYLTLLAVTSGHRSRPFGAIEPKLDSSGEREA